MIKFSKKEEKALTKYFESLKTKKEEDDFINYFIGVCIKKELNVSLKLILKEFEKDLKEILK